ncbi:MAG: HEAT repeat domain-containing protein [Armatimonadota bacterium]
MQSDPVQSQVEHQIARLDAPHPGARREAFDALARAGFAAVPPLCTVLKEGSVRARIAAAHLLAVIREPESVPAVMEAVWDPHLAVRRAAIAALGTMQAAEAVTVLIEVARLPAAACREDVLRALAKIHDPQTVPALCRFLTEGGSRAVIVEALAASGDPAAVPALAKLLGSAPSSAADIISALARIPHPDAAAALLQGLDRAGGTLRLRIEALQGLGAAAVPALIDALGGPADAANLSENLLSSMGDSVTPALSEALSAPADYRSHAAWNRRFRVIRLLASCGSPAVRPLVGTLRDPAPQVRKAAALALGLIGQPKAIPSLCPLLQSQAPGIREAAAVALVECGAAEEELIEHLVRGLELTVPNDLLPRAAAALTRIARDAPCSRLRLALPALRRIARNFFRPTAERSAAREAVSAIEAATAGLSDLPLPSSGAGGEAALPLPARAASATAPESLPRPQPAPETAGAAGDSPGDDFNLTRSTYG